MRKHKQNHQVGSQVYNTYDMRDAVGEFTMLSKYIAILNNDIVSGGLTTHVLCMFGCDEYRATGIK